MALIKERLLLFGLAPLLLLQACVFVPNTVEETSSCEMYFPKWTLSVAALENINVCGSSGQDAGACLVLAGAIIPAGSLVVSGSLVLVGNTAHWLEYQGRCDSSEINRGLSSLVDNINQ